MKRVISCKLVLGLGDGDGDGDVQVDGRTIYTAKDLRFLPRPRGSKSRVPTQDDTAFRHPAGMLLATRPQRLME